LGDRIPRSLPTLIPELSGVFQVVTGNAYTVLVNRCNSSYSGGLCQYPVCFNISAVSPLVCSGSGACVAPNKCQCSLPSQGDNCQYQEYHWVPVSGSWSTVSNWYVSRDGKLFSALTYPSLSGDTVYFDLPGTYTVQMDVPNLEMSSLSLGSDASSPTIQIVSKKITVTQNLYCHSTCTINAYTSSFSAGNMTILGNLNYYGDAPHKSNLPV
jgi:hypothetical protein